MTNMIENFNDLPRLIRIFKFANDCINKYGLPVRMLYFKRLQTIIDTHKLDIGNIEIVPLMPYKTYLTLCWNKLVCLTVATTRHLILPL